MKIYRGLKPYKGGNDSLWRLHCLNIADKHHILLPIIAAVQNQSTSTVIKYSRKVDWRLIVPPLPRAEEPRFIYAPEDGAILKRIVPRAPVPAEVNVNATFTFHVTLGQGEIREPEPVVPALDHFVYVVKEIAQQFIAAGAIT